MRVTLAILMVGLLALLAVGCSTSIDLESPPEVHYGEDVCEQCHMFISEERFAAAYVLGDGTSRIFDDLGDMLEYDRLNDEEVAVYWVHDFGSGEWVKAPDATIVLSDDIVTPMGHSLVAFATHADASEFVGERGGTISSFPELQSRFTNAESAVEPDPTSVHPHEPVTAADVLLGGDIVPMGQPINPPRPLPAFNLIDHQGQPFSNSDLSGKHALISFAYTSCPDVCPVLFGQYLQIQERFPELIGEDLELVIITVDPEVDTPERLAERTNLLEGQWSFLSGPLAEMKPIWYEFRVKVEKQGESVGHTGVTYLVDDTGMQVTRYPAFTGADQFVADLEKILAPQLLVDGGIDDDA